MKIGSNIRKMRELRSLTQDEMADKLSMSQNGYSRIERDETDVPFSRLVQIAKALEVELLDLITFDGDKLLLNQSFNDNSLANGIGYQHNQGLAEAERKLYESRITDLQKEIDRLHSLLEKTLSK
ncbi:MAG: helix-turn-helix transcriptional regulator [Microscillaceae bacterium]|nr:helix-turn-helix transcriptional regulator [Microscillaceae bacterium]